MFNPEMIIDLSHYKASQGLAQFSLRSHLPLLTSLLTPLQKIISTLTSLQQLSSTALMDTLLYIRPNPPLKF